MALPNWYYYLYGSPTCCNTPCNTTDPCADPCTTPSKQSSNLAYNGPDLPCTGIETCDTLSEAIQKIEEAICTILGMFTTTTTTTVAGTTTTTTTVAPTTTTTTTTVEGTTTTTTTVEPITTTTTTSDGFFRYVANFYTCVVGCTSPVITGVNVKSMVELNVQSFYSDAIGGGFYRITDTTTEDGYEIVTGAEYGSCPDIYVEICNPN